MRDYRRGDVLRIHLVDDSSVDGVLLRESRRFIHLEKGRVEGGGVLHALKSERLLVPRVGVKLVEVVGQ
jgi:hypothetical protein